MKSSDLTLRDIEWIVKINKEVEAEEAKYEKNLSKKDHYAEVYERFRIAKENGRVSNRTRSWRFYNDSNSDTRHGQGQKTKVLDR